MKTKLKISITMKDLLELVKMSQENNVDLEIITSESEEEKPVTAKEALEAIRREEALSNALALSRHKTSHEQLFNDFEEDFNSNMNVPKLEAPVADDNKTHKADILKDDIFKRIKEIKERLNKVSGPSKEDLEKAMELCRKNGLAVSKTSKKGKRGKADKRIVKSRQLEERIKLGIARGTDRRIFMLKNLPWLEKGVMEDLEALGYSTIGDILDSSATELAEKIGGKDANGGHVAADPEILDHMVNKIQEAMRKIGIYFRKNCYKDRGYGYRRKNEN
jgi:hypothetical protein